MPRKNHGGVVVLLFWSLLFMVGVKSILGEIVGSRVTYNGYKVIRTEQIGNHDRRGALLRAINASDDDHHHVSVWTRPVSARHIDLMISPDSFKYVTSKLEKHNTTWKLIISDVEARIKRQVIPEYSSGGSNPDPFLPDSFRLDEFHTVEEIHAWMEALAAQHPTMMRTKNIGSTFEKRNMKIMIVNPGKARKKIWIDGGIHAREWASVAVAAHLIDAFVFNYEQYKDIIDEFQWHILPVLNADGYAYSMTHDRLWRKTRSMTDSVFGCRGVDANRNWNFRWMVGAKKDPCSGLYAGPHPESEKCVQTVSNYVKTLNSLGTLVGFFTLHSYGQMWMSPWGYSAAYPPTYKDLMRVAEVGAKAAESVHGFRYQYGTAAQISGPASGSSDDWAYAVAKVPFVYTLELRDTGEHGFMLPAEQIRPCGEEVFVGIMAAAREIATIVDGSFPVVNISELSENHFRN